MNCEDFRNQLMIDPSRADEVSREHAATCPECARAREEARRFERTLRAALEAELASSDGEARATAGPERGPRSYLLFVLPVFLAVLWVGMRGGSGSHAGEELGELAIGHIQEEVHLRAEGLVSPAVLGGLLVSFGASLAQALGPIRFAERCVIGDDEGIHLVLPGERGAVTALFMPGKARRRRESFQGGGLHGLLVSAGPGSLAVVGEPGEPLDATARRLLDAVHWDYEER